MNELDSVIQGALEEIAGHQGGVLGDPRGEPAYAYARVSSAGQAEELASGLPRQLAHIDARARELQLRITSDQVYADDSTGFEFRTRAGLQRLLQEVKRVDRRAHAVVIEQIDRLSRNAKWHQGYLLDLLAEHKVAVHFAKTFNSEIERAVLGAISEQGMRENLERMKKGTQHKARSGRVTAKRAAYGYIFVDSQGRPAHDPASEYRRDTHYALHPDQAPIMREIYERICAGETLYQVCDDLDNRGVPTPDGSPAWSTGNVCKMLKNPVYKGEFVANRQYRSKEWSPRSQRMVVRDRQRPKEEWIIVPVPAIVSPRVWEATLQALKRNVKVSTRKAKIRFLLQGFLRCARCGRAFASGGSTGPRVDGLKTRFYYLCTSYQLPRILRKTQCCRSPYVFRDDIDTLVWQSICDIVANPELITSILEERAKAAGGAEVTDQMAYLARQLAKCEREQEQWDRAYAAGILILRDYGEKREAIQLRVKTLEGQRLELEEQFAQVQAIEDQVAVVQEQLAELRNSGFSADLSFKQKRRILGLLVTLITIDTVERWYKIEGVINQVFPLDIEDDSGDDGGFGYTSDL